MEEGELAVDTLRRELNEETGLQDFKLGPQVWLREHIFTWDGTTIHQKEDFYLIPSPRFRPSMAANPEQAEIDSFCQFRWWAVQDIMESDDLFVPRQLGQALTRLISQGVPQRPFDVGE